jgi:hypothetical protein
VAEVRDGFFRTTEWATLWAPVAAAEVVTPATTPAAAAGAEQGARLTAADGRSLAADTPLVFSRASTYAYPAGCANGAPVVFLQTNGGSPPAQVRWRSSGFTYWVNWEDLQWPLGVGPPVTAAATAAALVARGSLTGPIAASGGGAGAAAAEDGADESAGGDSGDESSGDERLPVGCGLCGVAFGPSSRRVPVHGSGGGGAMAHDECVDLALLEQAAARHRHGRRGSRAASAQGGQAGGGGDAAEAAADKGLCALCGDAVKATDVRQRATQGGRALQTQPRLCVYVLMV